MSTPSSNALATNTPTTAAMLMSATCSMNARPSQARTRLSLSGRIIVGQLVTQSGQSVQKRAAEGFVDRAAQSIQMTAQGVRIGEEVAPHLVFELLATYYSRRGAHEDGEKFDADGH